jgi:alpha-galactosidase
MDAGQLESVRAAVRAYRDIRADLAVAVPLWPLGLPAWDDPWLSLALRTGEAVYLAVWRRAGAKASTALSLPHLRGRTVDIEVLYPRRLPGWACEWAADTGSLTVTPTQQEPAAARLFRIVPTSPLPVERSSR